MNFRRLKDADCRYPRFSRNIERFWIYTQHKTTHIHTIALKGVHTSGRYEMTDPVFSWNAKLAQCRCCQPIVLSGEDIREETQ